MAALSAITTLQKNRPYTWSCDFVAVVPILKTPSKMKCFNGSEGLEQEHNIRRGTLLRVMVGLMKTMSVTMAVKEAMVMNANRNVLKKKDYLEAMMIQTTPTNVLCR